MRLAGVFILLLCVLSASAQTDSIVRYGNGRPQYILTYQDNILTKNIYLSPAGDTIYKWDLIRSEVTEYPITGEYLLQKEYESEKKPLLSVSPLENAPQLITAIATPPSAKEWGVMYHIFFERCKIYTQIIREGSFTIVTQNKNGVLSGPFKKYYKDAPVISGQYKNGKKSGVWQYRPYHYYPYYDVTFFDPWQREWSFIYSVVPALLSFILLVAIGLYLKGAGYQYYFYAVIVCAIVVLLLRLAIPFDRENVWLRFVIPAIWFVFWQVMTILAIVNLFFSGRRTNTHPVLNVVCILLGFSFSIFILFFKHLNF